MRTRSVVLGVGIAAVLSGSGVIAAIATTATPSSGHTVYQACLDTKHHKLVHVTTSTTPPTCGRHQKPVSWNASGADGVSVRSGSGAPAAATGSPGDFYIDTTTWQIYGPKSSDGWPAAHALTGPPGTNGTNGTNGQNGSNGSNGQNGTAGASVLSGACDVDSGWNRVQNGPVEAACPPAGVGHNGDFFIDTTNQRIFGPLTDGGWGDPTSIVGPQGDAGSSVRSGACPVDSGWNQVHNGPAEDSCPPPDTVGHNGDFFIDTTNWRIFGPLTDDGWGDPTSIIGPAGAGTSITDLSDLDGLTCATAGGTDGHVVTAVDGENNVTMTCEPNDP